MSESNKRGDSIDLKRRNDDDRRRSPPRRGRWSPQRRDDRRRQRSRSRDDRRRRASRSPPRRRGNANGGGRPRHKYDDDGDGSNMQWGKAGEAGGDAEREQMPEREPEPEFGLSGALAAEANTVNGVVILHTEPPEARPPTSRWRLYVFKGDEPVDEPLRLQGQSRFMFGRERRISDVPTDHPSCSKQHAVLQFRLTEKGGVEAVRPYLMDLGATNGTYLNGDRIEPERYYELLEKDLIKFGHSTRDYVLLRE